MSDPSASTPELVADLVRRSRAAQVKFATYNQAQVNEVVTAVAWVGYQQANAERLAQLAFDGSGLGNAADKVAKIRRKTKGTLTDIQNAPSVGVIREDPDQGLTVYAKPMGVIACLLPATNPAATAVNNIMITLKGGNAVILGPRPRGEAACAALVELVGAELETLGAPADLVQFLSLRGETKAAGKARAAELMRQCDHSLVTAGPKNVEMGYQSGSPSHGVGVGSAPVIIEASADLDAAIPQIVASKTFDYATNCSSENALLIEDSVYETVLDSLVAHGGYRLSADEKIRLQSAMWPDGRLSREVVAQPVDKIAALAGIRLPERLVNHLIVEETGIGPDYPFSGEKLSVVLTVFRHYDFDEAVERVQRILAYMGRGHSCGIHTSDEAHVRQLASSTDVSSVLVNQPHSANNGGSFDNGLTFTLSMGAGTWGKNNTTDNISYHHFLNYTYLARPIASREPSEEVLWGTYLQRQAA